MPTRVGAPSRRALNLASSFRISMEAFSAWWQFFSSGIGAPKTAMKPSPRNLLTIPWLRLTHSTMNSKSEFRYPTTSPGCDRSVNAVKLRMSRNMRHTFRISPSCPMFWARSLLTTSGETCCPKTPMTPVLFLVGALLALVGTEENGKQGKVQEKTRGGHEPFHEERVARDLREEVAVGLVQLDHAHRGAVLHHRGVDLEQCPPVFLDHVFLVFRLAELVRRPSRQRLDEGRVIRELLADFLARVAPDDGAIAAPHFHAEDRSQSEQAAQDALRVRRDSATGGGLEHLVDLGIVLHGQADELGKKADVGSELVVGNPAGQGYPEGHRDPENDDESGNGVLEHDVPAKSHSTPFLRPCNRKPKLPYVLRRKGAPWISVPAPRSGRRQRRVLLDGSRRTSIDYCSQRRGPHETPASHVPAGGRSGFGVRPGGGGSSVQRSAHRQPYRRFQGKPGVHRQQRGRHLPPAECHPEGRPLWIRFPAADRAFRHHE